MIEKKFSAAYMKVSADARISVWDISLYIALLHKWYENKCTNPFSITRKEVMKKAHIRSFATYHKSLKQLEAFGYIKYLPSYDPSLGSSLFITQP